MFVASRSGEPRSVIGYYSLSTGSLAATDLPEALRPRLLRYPVSAALLGRLAVARSHKGKGSGTILIADALQRIALASQEVALYAVVVDALNDGAAELHEQFGFIRLPSQPLKLCLPMDAITRTVA